MDWQGHKLASVYGMLASQVVTLAAMPHCWPQSLLLTETNIKKSEKHVFHANFSSDSPNCASSRTHCVLHKPQAPVTGLALAGNTSLADGLKLEMNPGSTCLPPDQRTPARRPAHCACPIASPENSRTSTRQLRRPAHTAPSHGPFKASSLLGTWAALPPTGRPALSSCQLLSGWPAALAVVGMRVGHQQVD